MPLRFLFDEHINAHALRQLRADGIDGVHVNEAGLSRCEDAEILAWTAKEDRIVVTRNYRDFAPLMEMYGRQGIPFPGLLFYAGSVRQSDVGHHVRALHEWIARAREADRNPAENGIGWLR